MNLHRLLSVAALVCAWWSQGCAGDTDVFQRELADVNKQVTQLRAENAAMRERLEALEVTGPVRLERELPPDEEERPELSVVRLEPDAAVPSQSVVAAPEVDAPTTPPAEAKTVIVGRGQKVESWERDGGAR